MDGFAHVQMEMQASIDSQTSMMHDLFGHFGMSPHLSRCVTSFSSYLITCLAHRITTVVMTTSKYCIP
jgi:hypothetical protein